MINHLVQAIGTRPGASTVASTIEAGVASGKLIPGSKLPTVRSLAAVLDVSPATVAAAYRTLKQRGFIVTDRGHGTTICARPPVRLQRTSELPKGVRDLTSGNPDPALLPALAPALARVDSTHTLYGSPPKLPQLTTRAEADFERDGINGDITVTGGALDAIERALQTVLLPGDHVVVEDPTWPRIPDLVHALGLALDPVAVNAGGLDVEGFETALRRGARAVIVTPRGQNPTGAAIDPARGLAVRAVLADYPDVLVIEDDYVARVAGKPYVPVHRIEGRWVVVRSFSKVLGPDLRLAVVAGDPLTVSRIEGRQRLGPGWVSHILQQIAVNLLKQPATSKTLARAEKTYTLRRRFLISALSDLGISATGDSGLGVWVPLADEAATVSQLLVRGWAVSPGERFRFRSAPGIRITTADLEPRDAQRLAEALAELRRSTDRTYDG